MDSQFVKNFRQANMRDAADMGNMYLDTRLGMFLNNDIYKGYKNLNTILDMYDKATTPKDRDTVINESYRIYARKTNNIKNWFTLFKNLSDYAAAVGDSPENVSRTMRHINDFTKNNLYQIS